MKCPLCKSKQSKNQPVAGTHAASTRFECGAMITEAIGNTSDEYTIDLKCNEKRDDTIDRIIEKLEKTIHIYIDMDGVLADFKAYVLEKYGKDYMQIINKKEFWDENHDGIFRKLSPLDDARHLVDRLVELKEEFPIELHILTALPHVGDESSHDVAKNDKMEWLLEYFPELHENFNVGPFAIDKQNHCKGKKYVLIDDNPRNIVQWIHAGGIGILHTSGNHKSSVRAVKEHLRQLGHEVDGQSCKNNLR